MAIDLDTGVRVWAFTRAMQHVWGGGFWKALGPGLLFAAAAVGVSHLVQSTRAGASYGTTLLSVVVLANLLKYPAFRFGPQYAAATGTSLLEGYRRQGRWALWLYALLTVATMFTIEAAVTLVTAGLALTLFGLTLSPVVVAGVLLLSCAGLLALGSYRWLDAAVKGLVAVLTVGTVAATLLVLPRVSWAGGVFPAPDQFDARMIFFVAALVGWMPSAIDIAVWQSLWTLARGRDTGHQPTLRESMLDFHIGYIATAFLALCFVLLGAGTLHGSGTALAEPAGQFTAQVIGMYESVLGGWSRWLIGPAAFAVMFSTTLTVVDGFPRALVTLVARLREPEVPGGSEPDRGAARWQYWAVVALLGIGSLVVLQAFLTSLKAMVDIATTLSFLTAPILAWLNHRAVCAVEVPAESRPGPGLRAMSVVGISFLGAFAAYYLVISFG